MELDAVEAGRDRPPRITVRQQKFAATQRRMSSSRPSRAFTAHSASANICRASRIASASPEASSSSATSGFVIRPTRSTGFVETFLIARVYSRSHPSSYVMGVWMYEWWTPAERSTKSMSASRSRSDTICFTSSSSRSPGQNDVELIR